MSLVADYSDSEESYASDHEVSRNGDTVTTDQTPLISDINSKEHVHQKDKSPKSKGPNANFLIPSSDSSDSDGDDQDGSNFKFGKSNKNATTLDNPFRTIGDVNVSKEDSVFRNPFRDKEDERIAVLEHHVKMTENPQTSILINGKKICWNYRKRKCYLGTKCPYAHDSDVPLTEEQLKEQQVENDLHRSAAGGSVNDETGSGLRTKYSKHTPTKTHLPGTASVVAGGYDSSAFFSSPHLGGKKEKVEDVLSDEEDKPYNKSKKKRAGLSNSLIPPKKAINLYNKTKDK